jgi:hypothetical protein
MFGAFGKMNLTSSNFCLRLKFCAKETQPAPESPRPWAMMTVAVCLVAAGMTSADMWGEKFQDNIELILMVRNHGWLPEQEKV